VAEFLKANQVEVREVEKGGSRYRTFVEQMNKKYGESWVHDMTPAEEAKKSELFNADTTDPTKFGQYTLPGAKEGSYRR
jgi:hypothetical protein